MEERQIIAKELLRIAKKLVAFEGEDELKKNLGIIADSAKRWKELNAETISATNELQKKINELIAQKTELENKMNENFPEFDQQTGVTVALKEAQDVLLGAVSMGEDIKSFLDQLSDIQEVIKIKATKSQTPVYKAMWEIIVSTLNSKEQEKFVESVVKAVRKNMVELNTGFNVMKTAANTWDKEFVDLYNERAEKWNKTHDKKEQMKLPKASIREAGLKDLVQNVSSWIKSKFSVLISKMKSITSSLIKTESEIEKARAGISNLSKLLKKA